METARATFFFSFLMLTVTSCGQDKDGRTTLGKAYAQKELKFALSNKNTTQCYR